MVGQDNLLESLKSLIDKNVLPRFLILVGSSGSGKKTLALEG